MRWDLIERLAKLLTTEQLTTSEATLSRVAREQEALVVEESMTVHEIDMAVAKSDAEIVLRENRARRDCAGRSRRDPRR